MRRNTFWLLLALLPASGASAQEPAADAYLDATARDLVARARAARGRQGAEIESYTALVLERSAARLRLPLRDRLLGREESAMRVRWSRDGLTVVQRLASREQELGGAPAPASGADVGEVFDPDADRIYFGIDLDVTDAESAESADSADGDDVSDFWIAHPLADGSERYYRYGTGDTLTLRLPGGLEVRSVELKAIPRRASFHHLEASLWIEPESGAVVQAVYRPARELDVQRDTVFVDPEEVDDLNVIPGMFRPIVIDLELISLEYALWDRRHWLPRRMSMGGYVRFGVMRLLFEAEMVYRIEEVEDEAVPGEPTAEEVLAAWGVDEPMTSDTVIDGGDTAVVFRPLDADALLESDLLPAPVWQDAPAFASSDELDALAERLESMAPGGGPAAPPAYDLQWLLGGRGLVRFNRIEALSLGVRGAVDHARGRGLATVRLGAADLHPGVELGALLPRRDFAWRVEAYHRLTTVRAGLPLFEAPPPALGLGNSLGALLFGRDDGQYYRASGALLALEPRPEQRPWYRLTLFAERQEPVRRKVEWNLAALFDEDRELRPNLRADDVDLAGASLTLAPWWGVGSGAQAGLELFADAAGGDSAFARARLTGRAILPLFASLRLGVEAAAGDSRGGTPVQYRWFLGGPESLRGYDGGALAGERMARARLELTRGGQALALALFSDAAWAGPRDAFDADDALVSAGLGFTVLDGLVRLDVARALRAPTGWRVHLYVDALL